MRQFARFEITKAGRMAVAEGAMRCVTAALAYEKNEQVMIEIASCEWALARYCPTDREYGIHLRRAIEYLSAPDLECSPVAQLALSFIYRSSFRPFHACLIYPVTLKENMHVRQVLRNSFIHAEAATQLSFREYPEEVVRPELQKAAVLLETAISAGYGTARLLCDLAFVRAALGDIGSATSVLSELVSSEGLNWTAIANAVREDRANDLFLESFAIGVAQSAILTRLGTFASRFLQDQQLAESLYRAALKINGSDAVALTNLARFLIRANRNLDEARRLLAHAESVADTRFVWWRHLKAKLEPRTTARPQRWIKRDPSSLKDLRHEFRRIKADDTNVQQRGYVLEALIQRMAEVTFGEALTPYRFDRVGGDESQVDGFFKHFADRYRVECKWENSLTKRPAIVVFHDKLGAAGVSGLFVSMAGFDDSAVAVARERASSKAILLMDGKEVEAVFEGWLDFEAVLSEKRTHFDAKSNPYHRVVTEEWF